MALTDVSDVFVSLHEDVLAVVIAQAMKQAPMLFNYATPAFIADPRRLCAELPQTSLRPDQAITKMGPLPIPGTSLGLEWCFQITRLAIDFHPGTIRLPSELNPPLREQRLAAAAVVCIGLGCPDLEELVRFVPPPEEAPPIDPTKKGAFDDRPGDLTEIVPVEQILPMHQQQCACLEIFFVGHAERGRFGERDFVELVVDGLEIVDVKPTGLENALECLIATALRVSVLPKLRLLVPQIAFNMGDQLAQLAGGSLPAGLNVVLGDFEMRLTPTSPKLPNNPAIEQDQLKVFLEMEVTP